MMDRKEFMKQSLAATAMFGAIPGIYTANNSSPELDSVLKFIPLFNGKDLNGFVNVNTTEDTWWVEDGILNASGHPTGFLRTERQYENFILDVEWRHMKAGGNSGVFILSNGTPYKDSPYPKGLEVQMLDPQWAEIHDKSIEYVKGQLFPAKNLKGVIPDNPSEIDGRSDALENRMHGTQKWNRYIVVCVDGAVQLAVNGKFVNGVRSTKRKKGYLCPESEGSQVQFRKIDIMELPDGVTSPDEIAPIVG